MAEDLERKRALLQQQMAIVSEKCRRSQDLLERKRPEKTVPEKKKPARTRCEARAPVLAAAIPSAAPRIRLPPRRVVKEERPEEALKRTGVYKKQRVPASMFPVRYSRGELPCVIEHRNGPKNGLTWVCPLLQLDYDYYLPIFFDGLRCTEDPAKFVARQGIDDLLHEANGHPDCILPCLADLIPPLRLALLTKDPSVITAALNAIQALVGAHKATIGPALVPHFKQLLHVLNLFLPKRRNTGDAIHYGQRHGLDLADLILATLELLERHGGKDAFAQIKHMVPAYESCLP